MDEGEVGEPVAAPRRGANRDEHGVGAPHGFAELGRERQTPRSDVARDEIGEPRLVDRHLAGAQARDLVGVLVDAADHVPEIREARARDQPDISRPDDRNLHETSPRQLE